MKRTFSFNLGTALMRIAISMVIIASVGCGTTQLRNATEQLVMSDAVDSAVSKIDFRPLSGRKVFLDTTYLRTIKGEAFVNAEYVISSLRQNMIAASCQIQETSDQADVIVEARVGTLANNRHEVVYGMPQSSSLSAASNAITGTPLIPPLPELSVARNDLTVGVSKVAVFAYDRATKEPIWQSGISKAESNAKNSWVMGIGPFQRGSIYQGYRFAGQDLVKRKELDASNPPIPFAAEHVFQQRQLQPQMAESPADNETPKALR